MCINQQQITVIAPDCVCGCPISIGIEGEDYGVEIMGLVGVASPLCLLLQVEENHLAAQCTSLADGKTGELLKPS